MMKWTAGILAAVAVWAGSARAQDTTPIANLETHVAADAAYQQADLAGRLELLAEWGKVRRISSDTATAMQIRVLQEHILKEGMDQDLPRLMKWLGGIEKDWQHPIRKSAGSALGEVIAVYGTRRLYEDPDFHQGDTIKKLLVIARFWKDKELNQSLAYALHNDLVYRYLQPAGDDIDKAIERFGELLRRDAVMWECGGGIHSALLWRALYERPGLDTVEAKLAAIRDLVGANQIHSLTPGRLSSTLLILRAAGDEDFMALDPEARQKKIGDWAADKLIDYSNRSRLLGAFAVGGK